MIRLEEMVLRVSRQRWFNSGPQLEVAQSARRKPYTAKTMGPGPLAAIGLQCIEWCLQTRRNGVPGVKKDLETFRVCVFAAPGSHRARTSVSISTAESGFNESPGWVRRSV